MRDRNHGFQTHKLPDRRPIHRRRRRWPFFVMITIPLLFLLLVVIASPDTPQNPEGYDPVTLEPKEPEGIIKKIGYFVMKKDTQLKGMRADRINVLVLGMGGLGHDGPYLTDTIILASIKPSTGDVALVSIPRDLGVKIPKKGIQKINHANHYGEMEKSDWGGAFATEVIEDTFDIKIPYYIRVDFQAFQEIVDEIGGVTVDIERSFTDTEYPAGVNKYQVVSFQKGIERMDGSRALTYARSRHGNNGEGSDFARSKRQQKILLALKEKILSFETLTNPLRIKRIMDAVERHMTTNMSFAEIMALVRVAKNVDAANINSLVLDNSPDGFLRSGVTNIGAYILTPKDGSFDHINAQIEHIFDSEYAYTVPEDQVAPEQDDVPEIALDGILIEIQNGTWRAGLAARVKAELEDIELTVHTIGNSDVDHKPIEKSGIYTISKDADIDIVLSELRSSLALPIKETIPIGAATTSVQTDILIVLGDDFVE